MARANPKSRRRGAAQRIKRRNEVSAGGLIWRRNADNSVNVVLVRPAGRRNWVLPKGHVEPGETVVDAAIREVREESGLRVGAIEPLGDVSYIFSSRERDGGPLVRIFKRVHFFLMECAGGDPSGHDSEIDEVAWLGVDEALIRATHRSERELIVKARGMVGA